MADYKIGEIFIVSADVELKDFLGDKTLVNKGTKIWVGADEFVHYQDDTIQPQPLPENSTIKGYDTKGIAERILLQLKADFPFDGTSIRDSIEYALEELGIC